MVIVPMVVVIREVMITSMLKVRAKAFSYINTNASPASNVCGSSEIEEKSFPKLIIPKFLGSSQDWIGFKDSFESLIISNERLNQATKLLYLKSYLDPVALALIMNVNSTTFNCFNTAWEILVTRFNICKEIVFAKFSKLLEFPKLKSETEANNLLDVFLQNVEVLKS